MYHKFKSVKTLEKHNEKGLAYYVINASWIIAWHSWVSGRPNSSHPGPINNMPIAERIMDFRLTGKHYLHDNGIKLKEPQEIYVLSYEFFSGFSFRYGVDVEIKLVRYKCIEDMCD